MVWQMVLKRPREFKGGREAERAEDAWFLALALPHGVSLGLSTHCPGLNLSSKEWSSGCPPVPGGFTCLWSLVLSVLLFEKYVHLALVKPAMALDPLWVPAQPALFPAALWGPPFISTEAMGECFLFVFRWCHYFPKVYFFFLNVLTIPGCWVHVKLLPFSYFKTDYLEMPFWN